uniref:Receptor protein-tyrosine kinase n=1 Tax=Clastoptera arizonana TaxID=38151 RepID=A0A1B6CIS1_9HEMI
MVNVHKLDLYILLILFIVGTSSGVEIISDKSEIVVKSGETFNITCKGQSPLEWEISNGEKPVARTQVTEENGIFTSTIVIQNPYYLNTGYVYCFPAGSNIDSENSSKIYLYVEDENHLLAVNDTIMVLVSFQFRTIVIPCRPTSPNINVTLQKDNNGVEDVKYDPRIGFVILNATFLDTGTYSCDAMLGSLTPEQFLIYVNIEVPPYTPHVDKPSITQSPKHVVIGQNVTLDCSVRVSTGAVINIIWKFPASITNKDRIVVMNDTFEDGKSHKKLVIHGVTAEDAGMYTCHVIDVFNNTNQNSLNLNVFHPDVKYLNISLNGNKPTIIADPGTPSMQWVVNIEAHPEVKEIVWYSPIGNVIMTGYANKKYEIENSKERTSTKLKIIGPDIDDSGVYTIKVDNDAFQKEMKLKLFVKATASLRIEGNNLGYYMAKKNHTVDCQVKAYPKPAVKWYFRECPDYPKCISQFSPLPPGSYEEHVQEDSVDMISTITMEKQVTGEVLCEACNQFDKNINVVCRNESAPYLIIEVENGFDASTQESVVETDNVTLTCGVTRYNYNDNIEWFYNNETTYMAINGYNDDGTNFQLDRFKTNFTYFANLNIPKIEKSDSGNYMCIVRDRYRIEKTESRKVIVNVKNLKKPEFSKETNMGEWKTKIGKSKEWNCDASGMPTPVFKWYKDGKLIPKNHTRMQVNHDGHKLFIKFVSLEDDGVYKCVVENKAGKIEASAKIILVDKPKPPNYFWWISIVLGLLLFFSIITIFFVRKNLKHKKFKKTMLEAGLLHFEKGNIESLNPDLDLQEQADLLPYNTKWEFPREKLKLGKQLGSGAFGVVMKAEALDLLEQDVYTTVAVKMVKRNSDFTYIKALASELKIMSHLGQNLNVVNLLGACTRNLNNRELLVMVEYCRYGNIHDYLLKHRNTFINKINLKTGEFESTVIQSPTTKSPRLKYADLTFSNGAPPNGESSGDMVTSDGSTVSATVGEDGYLMMKEPEWRSNYRGDYKSNSVRPICTQDLFCWGFQVARGMEYLASRKVMHGDLAARNILLADDNIVKICDFGFSKSMYKDQSYHKKGEGLLPVKWMSVEAIRDRVFSTQSDIWAFGIVLWEFFSLAETPYPGMEPDEKFYNKLIEGYRMEKPHYASNDVYKVMLECWHEKPNLRPSFTELAERLGDMLENTVKSHYIDLNDPYIKLNEEFLAQEDYLSLIKAPNYTNWVPAKEEGYTVMRPSFSDAKESLELAPMLDQATGEVNSETESASNSPKILKNSRKGNNYVNVHQAVSFSNPSYHNLGRPELNPYRNVPTISTER